MADRPSSSRGLTRPTSAQSRRAWDDDGIDNPAGPQSRGIYPDDDLPAAMECEMYNPSVAMPDSQGGHGNVVQVHETGDGILFKFKKGVRCKFLKIVILRYDSLKLFVCYPPGRTHFKNVYNLI